MEKINLKTFGLYLLSVIISCTIISAIVITCSSCIDAKNIYKGEPNNYEGWDYCGFNINNVVKTHMSLTENGETVYWIVYDDIDADFSKAIISIDEETFTILLEALDEIQDLEPYSQEWQEVCDKYEFAILYKGNTNVLVLVDRD